jgi:RNA polymerase sigma-70 factor (family 1)
MIPSPQFDEKELLSRLSQGDQHAFNLIYKTYSPAIYKSILRLVKQADLAEEVLQDVFIKIWEKRESIAVDSSFKAYLFRVAHNQIMDMFRRVSFDRRLFDHLAKVSTELYCNTEELTDLKDTQGLLNEAIDALSPQRKRIYLLCKVEGKSYEEVSKMLDISTSTISDHIVKATKSVKSKLSDKDYAIIMAGILISFQNK